MYDYSCGEHLFEAFAHIDEEEMPCRFCDKPATRDVIGSMQRGLPPRYERNMAQPFTPTTIHVNAKGEINFAMHSNAPIPPGYEKRELRTIAEIRKFEKQMNEKQRVEYVEHKSREHERFSAMQRERRKTMRQALETGSCMMRDKDGNPQRVDFSEADKDLARYAMEQNDQRAYMQRNWDAGFFLEALSMDSSNREGYRDVLTGWKTRR